VRGLNEKLDVKRRELDDANKKVEDLRYELDWAEKNKQRLEKEYTECEMSLKRASVIISSLGGEKVRWFELSEEFKREAEILDVNIFVASAQISYLGPFTQAFRQRILEEWMVQFNKTELKISDFSQLALARVLGKPIRVREWNMNGLPYDNFSV
jgi:dynein heavy chain